MIGQSFETMLRTLATSRMVRVEDRYIWEAAADAVFRLDGVSPNVRVVFVHGEFDPAMGVIDDFAQWLDRQREDVESAVDAVDVLRAQLASIRRHQDHECRS